MSETIVHSLNGRNHVVLDILVDHFKASAIDIRREIVSAVGTTTEILASKGVPYSELRAALTPSTRRQEIGLFFDTARISNSWYGRVVHDQLIPLLPKDGAHAILHGDIIANGLDDAVIRELLAQSITGSPGLDSISARQVYCVYVNNCSPQTRISIDRGFAGFPGYIGYADLTFTSFLKTLLSDVIGGGGYLQWRNVIIQTSPDDLPTGQNENTLGYAFEESGFSIRTVPDLYFGMLLSYKIERPVFSSVRDQVHSLNAISDRPVDVANCAIEIDERKYDYLKRSKSGSVRRLGIFGVPKANLEELVRRKLRSNYLYNMRFRADCSVATFNMVLELKALDTGQLVRTVAVFAYEESRDVIRLVTFY